MCRLPSGVVDANPKWVGGPLVPRWRVPEYYSERDGGGRSSYYSGSTSGTRDSSGGSWTGASRDCRGCSGRRPSGWTGTARSSTSTRRPRPCRNTALTHAHSPRPSPTGPVGRSHTVVVDKDPLLCSWIQSTVHLKWSSPSTPSYHPRFFLPGVVFPK